MPESNVSPEYQIGIQAIIKMEIAGAVTQLKANYAGEKTVFEGELIDFKMKDLCEFLKNIKKELAFPKSIKSIGKDRVFIRFSPQSKNFTFICNGKFSSKVDISIYFNLEKDDTGTGYNITFSGYLKIADYKFKVIFGKTKDVNIFGAICKSEGKISLKKIVSAIDEDLGRGISEDLEIPASEVKFIYLKEDAAAQYAFGLRLKGGFDLKNLPVIGDKVPDGFDMGISNLELLIASSAFETEKVATINEALNNPDNEQSLWINTETLSKGIVLLGDLKIKDQTTKLNLGSGGDNTGTQLDSKQGTSEQSNTTPIKGTSEEVAIEPSAMKWFDIKKQLGPINFQRIGASFEGGAISIALDISLAMGPANLTMQGLEVSSKLDKFDPKFDLQGFFFNIESSSLKIGGGFLRSKYNGADAYLGAVTAQMGSFGLKALGGNIMAHKEGNIDVPNSFFIYANINYPLGGPPFFFVTGLAGGFGMNSLLKMPTMADLPSYILLPANASPQGATPSESISNALPALQEYLEPKTGEYWFAVGVAFTSFEMIESFAVLSISLGSNLQIALLGTSTMNFPKKTPNPIAYIEVAIKAVFSEKDGVISVQGIVTPSSYIFGPFCQLTGGFAFYIWFDPPQIHGANSPQKGDFVVTLGGYHPTFNAPSYYPTVPRLGINFNLGPFKVVGQAYFALTPSMFMAGMDVYATWKLGPITAWFAIGAHFLIEWAPFHYKAIIYIQLGCKFKILFFKFNFSVGARLAIWGPTFGGIATVDLGVIELEIKFGGGDRVPAPIGWATFRESFLPKDTNKKNNIIKITIPEGLNNTHGDNWILDPNHFRIAINTTIPANELLLQDDENNQSNSSATLNIRPMKLHDIKSSLKVEITYNGNYINFLHYNEFQSVPTALWGQSGQLNANDSRFIDGTLCGVNILPPIFNPSKTSEVEKNFLLFQQGNNYYFDLNPPYLKSDYDDSVMTCYKDIQDDGKLLLRIKLDGAISTIMKSSVLTAMLSLKDTVDKRASILSEFNRIGFETYKDVSLETFANSTSLTDYPEVILLFKSTNL